MTITPPTTPAGVLELLPSEQAVHDAMLDTIRRGYLRFGFVPIETPAFERTDVLLTKTGGDTEKQVYYVQSAGALEQGSDPDLALRFDLTVPLARYVAEHEHDLVFPFRRSQIQRVYRGERPQRGRYREFYQCDIDVIDRDDLSLRHDAEVPAAMITILDELDIGDTTVRVNNRRLMRTLLEDCDIADSAAQEDVLREVDKLDRLEAGAIAARLVDGGMSRAAVDRLLAWTAIEASGRTEIEQALSDLPASTRQAGAGGLELAEVIRTMDDLGAPADSYELDLSIARGLDYYTGTVYETTLDAHPELGSICSGGRYDDLAGQYTKTRLPGVGMSIGFTRLYWQLREAGILPPSRPAIAVMVTLMDDADLPYALGAASRLRAAGIATETTMTAARLGRQLKNADRAGIPIALIAGTEERESTTVTVRDLVTGNQERVGLDELVDHVRKLQNG
ncbi:MAG: histidine--tRNA ligase [Acidimicrobiia bacterium]